MRILKTNIKHLDIKYVIVMCAVVVIAIFLIVGFLEGNPVKPEDKVITNVKDIKQVSEVYDYENISVDNSEDAHHHKAVYNYMAGDLTLEENDITELYSPTGEYASIISFSEKWKPYAEAIKNKYKELSIFTNIGDRTDDYSVICVVASNEAGDVVAQLCGSPDNSQQLSFKAVVDFDNEDKLREIINAINYISGLKLSDIDAKALKSNLDYEIGNGHEGYLSFEDSEDKIVLSLECGESENGRVYALSVVRIISYPVGELGEAE